MKTKFFISVLAVVLAAPNFLTAQNEKVGSIVRAYFAAVDAGETQKVEALCSAGFMASAPFLPQAVPISAWKEVGAGFKAGFPDMRHEIVDWFSDGQKVAVRGVFSGTNTGPMQGNPPTGNKVALPFNSYFELDKDLKIKAVYIQFDQTSFQQQLMAGLPDPKAVAASAIQAYFAAVDAGETQKVEALCSAGFMASAPFLPQPVPVSVWKEVGAGFKAGFPDMRHEIVDWFSDGHKVAVRGLFTGTNTGPMQGNPPSGNKVALPFNAYFEMDKDFKIKSLHIQFDQVAFQQQLMAGR